MDIGDAERTRLIGASRGLMSRGESDEGDKQRLSALAGDLFGLVALEDLERYPARDLAEFVRSADSVMAARKPGETIVRITDPALRLRTAKPPTTQSRWSRSSTTTCRSSSTPPCWSSRPWASR